MSDVLPTGPRPTILQNLPDTPPKGMSQADYDGLRESAQEFEAMMLGEMLAPMFQGLQTDGPFGGGQAEEQWRGIMVREYGAEIARTGGIGIADQIVRQLLQFQEIQD
ncbi:MAG: rod-binding protein [Pseudomonadota bacterium]